MASRRETRITGDQDVVVVFNCKDFFINDKCIEDIILDTIRKRLKTIDLESNRAVSSKLITSIIESLETDSGKNKSTIRRLRVKGKSCS